MIDLADKKVQAAVREYIKKHGGSFFYEEPGNTVIYENEQRCVSFDDVLSNEAFIAVLKKE